MIGREEESSLTRTRFIHVFISALSVRYGFIIQRWKTVVNPVRNVSLRVRSVRNNIYYEHVRIRIYHMNHSIQTMLETHKLLK